MRRTWKSAVERGLGEESGFTIIELIMTAVILAIISAPISGVLLAAAAQSKGSRETSEATQLLQSQVETIRTMAYSQVGVGGGNPQGDLDPSDNFTLPNGTAVTLTTKVTYVTDNIPGHYVTNADYKKVVLTITRSSDNRQLASATTYVSAAAAPPLSGSGWVQIKRQVSDVVTNAILQGASVEVTGGPSTNPVTDETDTTDGSGSVLFPGLAYAATGSPAYTLATTFTGYSVYPDDLPPAAAEQVASTPGANSIGSVRMYKNGVTLTVNLQTSGGAAWTTGATVSLESTRCGIATQSVSSGTSSVPFTNCNWMNGKNVSLVPNVNGQSPAFAQYGVTAWNGNTWGSALVTVPSAYPTTLTQSTNLKLNTTMGGTKTVNVTITKGGSADKNARVYLTATVGGLAIYLYANTNSSGLATFTIPVTSTSVTYTIGANDQATVQGSTTFSASTSTSSPITAPTIAVS